MSYLIQNFYRPTKRFSPSVHYILLTHCKNLYKLYTFFRLFDFYWKAPYAPYLINIYADIFRPYFFDEPFVFFYDLFKQNTLPHLTSKFQKSLRLFSLQSLNNLMISKSSRPFLTTVEDTLLFNTYFFSEKIIFFPLKNTFYRPIFLLSLLQLPQLWPFISEYFLFATRVINIQSNHNFIYFINKRVFKTQRL